MSPETKDILLLGVVPIVAAVIGTTIIPLFNYTKRLLGPTYDDRQSLVGNYTCEWFVEDEGIESLYVSDQVEITEIQGSQFKGCGNDSRFKYRITGNISRGNVISFYYIIHNRQLSLTGSGTMKINPMGSFLEGKWYGYTSEDKLRGGKVVWKRIP